MRITIICSPFIAALTIGACAATPNYQPISTQDEYMSSVVGRSVRLGGSSAVTTYPDGTMKGTADGKDVVGTWTWEDGRFCREGTVGSNDMKRDCQKLEIADNRLRVTRGDGSISEFDLR